MDRLDFVIRRFCSVKALWGVSSLPARERWMLLSEDFRSFRELGGVRFFVGVSALFSCKGWCLDFIFWLRNKFSLFWDSLSRILAVGVNWVWSIEHSGGMDLEPLLPTLSARFFMKL